jgi:hypothetical protein
LCLEATGLPRGRRAVQSRFTLRDCLGFLGGSASSSSDKPVGDMNRSVAEACAKYAPVETDGAARAAARIAELF